MSRPTSVYRRPALERWLAGSLVVGLACAPTSGGDSKPDGDRGSGPRTAQEVELERVAFLLVERPESMRVLEAVEGRSVDFGMLQPRPSSTHDAGPLPSLRMTAGAVVEFELPELPRGSSLSFAMGIARAGYELEGRQEVRFRVGCVAAGAEEPSYPVSETLIASRRLPNRQQVWRRATIPLENVRTLRFETAFDGRAEPPQVGFGLLEVRVPFRVQRQQASAERPNVVLVLIDTLRADRLGAYGSERGLTPHLDELAGQGTVYERCYAPASWTWPSTASLLTGLAPPAHGVEHERSCFLSHDLVTLAEAFRDEGVRTAAFSTNKLIGPSKNFDQGFEHFRLEPWMPTRELRPAIESWVRKNANERFFLYLHVTDPHTPYAPPDDLRERLVGPEPEGWEPGEAWREIQKRLAGEPHDAERITAFSAYDRELYDAEVAGIDRELGRLRELLGELGLADETIVCVTSDHGEEFHEHGMYHHTKQLFDEVLHVPLLLAGPGVPAGARHAEPVPLQGLGADLLSRAGVGGGSFEGRGLTPATSERPLFFSTAVGWWYDEVSDELVLKESPLYGLADGQEHFVWGPPPEGSDGPHRARLFDLAKDPEQRTDLSARRPEAVVEHRGALERWLEESLRRRPNTFGGDDDVRALLEELGYVLGDDEQE